MITVADRPMVDAMLAQLDRDEFIELDPGAADAITQALKRYAAQVFVDETYRQTWSSKDERQWRQAIAKHTDELQKLLARPWPTDDPAMQHASRHYLRHAMRDDPFWFMDRDDFLSKLETIQRAALKEMPPIHKGGNPSQAARRELHVELVDVFVNFSEPYQSDPDFKTDIRKFTCALNKHFDLDLPTNRESIRAVCAK